MARKLFSFRFENSFERKIENIQKKFGFRTKTQTLMQAVNLLYREHPKKRWSK